MKLAKTTNGRRAAILEAALQVVTVKGYYETRIDDIARVANCAKGTVYLYFRDKPDIYLGLVDWLLRRALNIVSKIDAQSLPPEKKLAMIFTEWAEQIFTRPGILALVSLEHANVPGAAARRFQHTILPRLKKIVRALARIIQPGIDAGVFRQVDARLAALAFLQAFRTEIIAHRQKIGIRNQPNEVLNLFLSGLLSRSKE